MIIQNKDRSTNPRKQYKADKQALNSEIKSHTICLNHAIEDLNRARETYGFNSNEYNAAFIQTERWRYCIEENNLALKFVRPNNQKDIEYRINQYNEFTEKLQSVISKNLDLRFHGTPIYFAEQIIKTKTIINSYIFCSLYINILFILFLLISSKLLIFPIPFSLILLYVSI